MPPAKRLTANTAALRLPLHLLGDLSDHAIMHQHFHRSHIHAFPAAPLSRRDFLYAAAVTAAALATKPLAAQPAPPPTKKAGRRISHGVGSLTMGQLLPAFAKCDLCRPVALVSGHPDKARQQAGGFYNIDPKHIYSYENFDTIKDNPQIDVVYVVLPNSMHAEYTIRAAKAGKHVLSEKPMANTVEECQSMIDACSAADRKLMVAYRMRYEAMTIRMPSNFPIHPPTSAPSNRSPPKPASTPAIPINGVSIKTRWRGPPDGHRHLRPQRHPLYSPARNPPKSPPSPTPRPTIRRLSRKSKRPLLSTSAAWTPACSPRSSPATVSAATASASTARTANWNPNRYRHTPTVAYGSRTTADPNRKSPTSPLTISPPRWITSPTASKTISPS